MRAIAVLNSGMVTGVGFNAPASCAAIRVGITGFNETRFMFDGEWLTGCAIPFEQGWRGREKLIQMVVPAIEECMANLGNMPPQEIPLIICVAEADRPGRFAGLDESFLQDVQTRLGKNFHHESTIIASGRIAGAQGLARARALIAAGWPYCILAGVDTFLVADTLNAYYEKKRLLTENNSNGFIPGEAGVAVLLGPANDGSGKQLRCLGIGTGTEPAPVDSEKPLRADGMVQAFKAALADSGRTFEDLDYRIADVSGEQYGFKEAALAMTRTLRVRKEEFDIWHPADCIGEVGAAIVPVVLAIALAAARKNYAPGPGALCHFAGDDSERAAVILRYENGRSA